MAAVLLDTTILIDLLRGAAGVQRRLMLLRDSGDEPCTCAINVEETIRGLRAPEEGAAARLFDGLRIAPLGRAEGWRAGEWRRHFAAHGTSLAQADCLIAAAALGARARLATGNPKHFPMEDIVLEHWPAGEG